MTRRNMNKWGRTPRVGTKSNEIFRMLLAGVSSREIQKKSDLHAVIRKLENECGYEIRSFRGKPDGKSTGKGSPVCPTIYKIVGRYKWDGGYVSFTEKYANEQ